MNAKKAKKLRKEARRYSEVLIGEGFEAVGNLIRSRPKWIPKILWILLYVPLFKVKYLKIVYKNL